MKEILITSSVLIAVLLLLRVIFAKKVSRVLIYSAWALVALRLLIPVQIGQLNFSVLTAARPVVEAVEEQVKDAVLGTTPQAAYRDQVEHYIEKDQTVFVPQVQEQIRQELAQGNQMPDQIYDKIQQQFPEQEILTPEGQETVAVLVGMENTTRLHNAGMVLTTIWIVGIVAMAVWFVVVNTIYSRKLKKDRQTLEVDCPLTVYVSENAVSPCLVGLFHPAIYLTPECAADETTRRHVLTHEQTHYAHKDHIWSVVRCVCLCIYWFDPLVWVAAWFSRRDCELACDEGALKRLGEGERIAYGRSLLDVVSHASAPAHLMETATAMNETKKQLKERVNFIVKKPKISLIAAICMVIVCAIVAGCAAAGPGSNWKKMEKQIKEDAVKFFSTKDSTCQPEDVRLRLISQFDDTYVMFVDVPFLCYLTDIETEQINGLEFRYSSSQRMYVYKGGSFTRLKEAYEAGQLNDRQLQKVWEDYRGYKMQPPQTDNQPTGSKPSGGVPEPGPTNPPQAFKQVYLLTQIHTEMEESSGTRNAVLSYDDKWNLTDYVIYHYESEMWRNRVETNTEERTIKVYSQYSALLEEYTYDAEGKLVKQIEYINEKRRNETEYFYDAAGRLLKEETLKWNGVENVPSGQQERILVYDADGKLQTESYYMVLLSNGEPTPNSCIRTLHCVYQYNGRGELSRMEQYNGVNQLIGYTVYSYGEAMRTITEKEYSGKGVLGQTTITLYDPAGNPVQMIVDDGNYVKTTTYTYQMVQVPWDFIAPQIDELTNMEMFVIPQSIAPSEPEPSTPSKPTEPQNMPFEVKSVTASVFPEYDYGNGYPIALIINSKAGIEAHLSRLGYPEYLPIMEAAEQYDDAFFESHSLILVWNTPGSSSNRYRVNTVTRMAEDEIEIKIYRQEQEDGVQDTVSTLFFLEIAEKISEKTVTNVQYLYEPANPGGSTEPDHNDQPGEPMNAVFNTKNIVRITFYAYYGQGKGSDVPAENMAEIIHWLNSFTVGEKAPAILPPGTGTYQVEIAYADGTVVKQSLDIISINDVTYYLNSDPWPEILDKIISVISL